jgi:Zn-dependent protease with chaperone function
MSVPTVAIRPRRSMMWFAILAILMVIASYVFVLLLAAACLLLSYAVASSSSVGFQSLLLALFGVVIAGGLLWSLVPRPDKFKAPGPELDREQHPLLFAELERIAASLNEPMPREVYLISDVNAWVADRGGMLGFGSRRVMGLGLPLMSVPTVSQFRAVLAHEFAHYYGGDTSLGPWVYKTKMAMIRTFQTMGSLGHLARYAILAILHLIVSTILKWYFIVFLRAINLVSRRQEFRADELACLVAGPKPLIDGLRTIHATSPAWQAYWNTEVSPILSTGRLPPLGEGFARFLASPLIAPQAEANVQKELKEGKSSPYDTHPPLRERIAAAEQLPASELPEDTRSASSLLTAPETLELNFLRAAIPDLPADKLRSVAWDAVSAEVTVPAWRQTAEESGPAFQGITVESMVDAIPKLRDIGARLRDPKGMLLTPEQRTQRAGWMLSIGLGLVMLENGWELRCGPGVFHLQRGEQTLNPLRVVDDMMKGKLSRDAWAQQCRELELPESVLFPQVKVPQEI